MNDQCTGGALPGRLLVLTCPAAVISRIFHRDAVLRDLSGQLCHLDRLLTGADSAPAEWQEYLNNGIAQLRKAFSQSSEDAEPVKGQPQSMEGTELITF